MAAKMEVVDMVRVDSLVYHQGCSRKLSSSTPVRCVKEGDNLGNMFCLAEIGRVLNDELFVCLEYHVSNTNRCKLCPRICCIAVCYHRIGAW